METDLKERIKELEKERDELKAHCLLYGKAFEDMHEHIVAINGDRYMNIENIEFSKLVILYSQKPKQSLLEIKARAIADLMDGNPDGVVTLKNGKTMDLDNWLFFRANNRRNGKEGG